MPKHPFFSNMNDNFNKKNPEDNGAAFDLKLIAKKMFLRTYAYAPKGNSINLKFDVMEERPQLDAADYWDLFYDWNNEDSFSTQVLKFLLIRPFKIFINATKLVTEFLPGFLHQVLDAYLFEKKSLHETKTFAEQHPVSAFFAMPFYLLTLGIFIIGRAITSPVASVQAAYHSVSNKFIRENRLLGNALRIGLVLGSLAISASFYAAGSVALATVIGITTAPAAIVSLGQFFASGAGMAAATTGLGVLIGLVSPVAILISQRIYSFIGTFKNNMLDVEIEKQSEISSPSLKTISNTLGLDIELSPEELKPSQSAVNNTVAEQATKTQKTIAAPSLSYTKLGRIGIAFWRTCTKEARDCKNIFQATPDKNSRLISYNEL